ncbi:MAG TPA: hypothetical protein PLO25_02985 [Candidatus Saccharibacteria bacterium]|nr:hypothetical protein [Candidatus Saccharibacteria bacterium]
MIRLVVYLLVGLVGSVSAYKCYSIGYGKKINNPFANYIFFSAAIVALTGYISSLMIGLVIYTSDDSLLYWFDLIGRALYYSMGIFAVQVPLYKFYPSSKKRFLVSFFVALAGIGLIIYQLINRNQPTMGSNEIINFDADFILVSGMVLVAVVPWIMTGIIFIREYFKNMFKSPKPLIIGLGSIVLSIGAVFQDVFSDIRLFVLFSAVFVIGFLLIIVGFFMTNSDNISINKKVFVI